MKISFNLKPKVGPYGGGNSFLSNLTNGLENSGFEVTHDLEDDNLDFIMLLDPRWRHPLSTFNSSTVLKYLIKSKKTIVIHRINECDERKDSDFMNKKLRTLNYLADSTIFVASWLRELNVTYKQPGYQTNRTFDKVIKNGSDKRIFFPDKNNFWTRNSKLRIVTHHWSANPMKGLDVYQKLDDLLSIDQFSNWLEFTYIGNVPKEAHFRNTKIISPLHGHDLAAELRSHHVYLTGSKNEPGGNHQNEGALSGLPIIYLDSGCMREYCEGYGIGIKNETELANALSQMRNDYAKIKPQMKHFPNDSTNMISNYIEHLNFLDSERNSIIHYRNLHRNRKTLLRLKFPL